MTQKSIASILGIVLLNALPIYSQYSASQKIQVDSLPIEQRESIPAEMSSDELEKHADMLRAEKAYFDAFDYYRAAIVKNPNSAVLYNKLGINELLSQRLDEAHKDFERSLKLSPHYA